MNKPSKLPVHEKNASRPSNRWIVQVAFFTLGGGFLAAATSLYLGQKEWALGFFLGALLAPLNLFSLAKVTARVLSAGEGSGRILFWRNQIFRWVLFAGVIGVLIRLSVSCLLGALGSYFWFLSVLAWSGLRNLPQKPGFPPEK